MQDFTDRVAIVTGSASGIGRATAEALARQGARMLLADIDLDGVRSTAAAIRALGGTALATRCDVTEDGAFIELRDLALDRFGRVDIVMNNAGGLTRGLPEHLPIEEWTRMLDLNLLSFVRSNLAFLPLLIAQGEGHIVNTASFAGLMTYAFDRLPYSAAKAAVVQMSEGLAIYLRPQGIGVSLLCPGPVRTNIMSSIRAFGPPTDTRGPGPAYRPLCAEEVGEMVVDGIRANRFMLPTHERIRDDLISRASDWDAFIERQIESPHIVTHAGPAQSD